MPELNLVSWRKAKLVFSPKLKSTVSDFERALDGYEKASKAYANELKKTPTDDRALKTHATLIQKQVASMQLQVKALMKGGDVKTYPTLKDYEKKLQGAAFSVFKSLQQLG